MNTQIPNFIMKRYANEQIIFSSRVSLINMKLLYLIIFIVVLFHFVIYFNVNSMIQDSQISNMVGFMMFFDIVIVLLILNFVFKGYLIVTPNTVSYEMIMGSMKVNILDIVYNLNDNNSIKINLGNNINPISIYFASNQDLEQFVNVVRLNNNEK
ncbi:MAG: hypothetical protein V3575_02830 [Candidatus Absconditabacteria bacterium]